MNVHPEVQFSTIAELLFLDAPNLNFARLVSDLDAVLARFRRLERKLIWDYENTASFDMPGTRIVLSTAEHSRPGVALALVISVGPSDTPAQDGLPLRHDVVCSRLVERVRTRLHPDAVFWHESQGAVCSDLLDNLAEAVSYIVPRNAPDHPIFANVDDAKIDALYAMGFNPTNDRPHVPAPRNPELARLRAALYPPEAAPAINDLASPQMRLAVHSMNATLIMVALPIGAALMTYSVLRGDNMRLTSRALVATGIATSLLHSPLAAQMVAMTGI